MLPPIETPESLPFREEEPLIGDQGAFHCQRSGRCASIARCVRTGSVSPHAAPTEGALRTAPHTVPSGADEPRLLMPWLGRASAFFTYRAALP